MSSNLLRHLYCMAFYPPHDVFDLNIGTYTDLGNKLSYSLEFVTMENQR